MPAGAAATQVLAYLLDSLWIGGALLLTAWTSLRAVRGTATVRCGVYTIALLLIGVVPLLIRFEPFARRADAASPQRQTP